MRMPRHARPAPGFSLLEALVTLVIVALIVTLLMQALGQALNLRGLVLRHQRQAIAAALQEQWFRDTVSTALSDLPDVLGRMAGKADELELVTPRALGGGDLQRVRWSLQPVAGGMALHYGDSTWPDLTVIAGPLLDATFAYLDAAGEWHDEWAPAADSQEVLPRIVRLQALTATGQLYWLVPVAADPGPPRFLRPEDAADGL